MSKQEPNLSWRAEAMIRERIIRGDFAFGERLSDRTLASAVGISRTPIREALARLATEDLVSIRPQSGTFVMCPTAETIRAVCEMRAVLECGALRIVAERGSPDARRIILATAERGERAVRSGDLSEAAALDSAFHVALVGGAGNLLLSRAYSSIADKIEAIRHRLPDDGERMAAAAAQHRRIVELALDGDLPRAEAELAVHVRRVQDLATTIVGAGGWTDDDL